MREVMSAAPHGDHPADLLGGSQLSQRLRSVDPAAEAFRRPEFVPVGTGVQPGPATQVELSETDVRFFVPFTGDKPSEHWLHAFRDTRLPWPEHLAPPRLEDGRGVRLGPLPVRTLAEHVEALKGRIDAANDLYRLEIEPELRRQREEALRREEEARRLRDDVDAELKRLLG